MTKPDSNENKTQRLLTQEERDYIAARLTEDNRDSSKVNRTPVQYKETFYQKVVKRTIDIIVSFFALIISSPINLIIMIVTFFDVGRPIIFKQQRVGKNEKRFNIVKFRNMRNDVDENGELLPAYLRVTKWGKFVRKTSLDELLNFWSVFKGDMSLIGPRPSTEHYLSRYSERHRARLKVKPGLECPPWDMNIESWDWEDRFENDVWYVEHISFKVDCIMIIRLFQYAFNKKIAKKRAKAKTGIFIGYYEGRAVNINQLPDEYIDRCLKDFHAAD